MCKTGDCQVSWSQAGLPTLGLSHLMALGLDSNTSRAMRWSSVPDHVGTVGLRNWNSSYARLCFFTTFIYSLNIY